jgi:hypothetical protein
MRTTLTLAAAVALLGLTGTAATAQMPMKQTTTTTTPMGTATTTTRTHMDGMGKMDGMGGKMDEKSTTRTKTSTVVRHGHMATARSSRHCKTWWKHGRKMRSCKTMTHVHHMG